MSAVYGNIRTDTHQTYNIFFWLGKLPQPIQFENVHISSSLIIAPLFLELLDPTVQPILIISTFFALGLGRVSFALSIIVFLFPLRFAIPLQCDVCHSVKLSITIRCTKHQKLVVSQKIKRGIKPKIFPERWTI